MSLTARANNSGDLVISRNGIAVALLGIVEGDRLTLSRYGTRVATRELNAVRRAADTFGWVHALVEDHLRSELTGAQMREIESALEILYDLSSHDPR